MREHKKAQQMQEAGMLWSSFGGVVTLRLVRVLSLSRRRCSRDALTSLHKSVSSSRDKK